MKELTKSALLVSVALMAGLSQSEARDRDTTFVANGNPLVRYEYTADPAAFVDNDGTLYLYAGHDVCPAPQNYYRIDEWSVFSTKDMKTWTQHPTPLHAKDFDWATGEAWASQVIRKGDKYYWYVTVQHKDVDGKRGKAIGVAVSDSPVGPFKDAIGHALITNNMTTQYTKISWEDIDPTVWLDADGTPYLIWGNTQCYIAKLKPNMIELDGEIKTIDINGIHTPANPQEGKSFYTEAPWIHMYKGMYYLSFAMEFPEKLGYATSKSIWGPYEYKGILNELAGNCNTNHHAIVEKDGKWYFIYHNGGANADGGSFRRSVCIDELYYDKKGNIETIKMTTQGIW
nr:xylanase Txyn43A [uncultured Bacteroides sp.]